MKEMDCVEVIVEKETYAKEGVHNSVPLGRVLLRPLRPTLPSGSMSQL